MSLQENKNLCLARFLLRISNKRITYTGWFRITTWIVLIYWKRCFLKLSWFCWLVQFVLFSVVVFWRWWLKKKIRISFGAEGVTGGRWGAVEKKYIFFVFGYYESLPKTLYKTSFVIYAPHTFSKGNVILQTDAQATCITVCSQKFFLLFHFCFSFYILIH